ncbi:MAG TPA: protein kinase [Pyrinomonadaceae bacterium]|nr:protein kinase [Pyrinomonadaceae bacterium]
MSPERWQKVDRVFKSALELPTEERAAFVERACAGDAELRAEVSSLIEHDREASLLERPAAEEATRLLAEEGEREHAPAGKTFGPYRVVSRLGAGGMGEVHLAVHERTGRRVALKLLPARHTGDEQRVRRFQQEARAVLALNHPNIVTVYDIEQSGGEFVIASELIEGETLRARVSRGPLAPAEALEVASQVAAALAAAHAAGIVHRDVKPENVMLRPDGFVKVLDFGLAKLAEKAGAGDSETPTLARVSTDPGVVMGTVGYMSPEQARGKEVDARTDIWSLGVLLYEMLTARAPFAGETPTDTLAAIIGKEPPPLARHIRDAPEALEWIVTKALTKDRDGRYQTAKEFLSDLKRLKQQLEFAAVASRSADGDAHGSASTAGAGAPAQKTEADSGAAHTGGAGATRGGVEARQTSSAEVILGELNRHRRGLAVAAVVALALAAGGFVLYKFTRGAREPRTPFRKVSVRQLADTGQAIDVAVSPDGEFVAYVRAEVGRYSLWLRQASEVSGVQVVSAVEGQRFGQPVFSHDGAFVYYLKAPSRVQRATLYRVPKLGGNETKLFEDISLQDTRSNFSLSPDGKRVAFIKLDDKLNRSLVVANHDGTAPRVIYERKLPEFISGAQWSPDGRHVACAQGTFVGSKVLLVVGVEDGSVRQLTGKWLHVDSFAWLKDSVGLVVSAAEAGEIYQLWRVPFPEGDAERITNDVTTYQGVGLTADSSVLAVVQVNSVQNIWVAPSARGGVTSAAEAARVTSGGGRADGHRGLAWTPDGRVFYHSVAGGSDDIWVSNADGSGQRRLTDGQGTYVYPAVSPDGRYVYYCVDRAGKGDLWRVGADGSDAKLLAQECGSPSPSPDGRWVLCYTGGTGIVWRVPAEGGERVRVQVGENALAASPVVSPDGRLVAYNYSTGEPGSRWNIAVFPFEGGAAPLKTFEVPGSPVRTVRWTPDGRAVCYIKTQPAASNIMCQPLDGGAPFQATDFKSDHIDSFGWSADGRRLALARMSVTSGVVLITDSR